ncbi:MAG: SDR family NAD(P)-dependent oxidoreductase [Chloroflexi bacterium]|nr:SDR family NAD(P)-dependent oxidoreductase [Chloroflexota bacterium]
MPRLQDKVAIVTGSGIGIGREVALALAREGARVVTNNRKPGSEGGDAQTTADAIIKMGGRAAPFFGDVSDFETARRFVETAVKTFGRVDILVNNAGGYDEHAMPWEMTEKGFDDTIRVHVKSAFNCIRHACGLMKDQRWGRIINTTSRAWLGAIEWSNYSAAKGALVSYTRAVARDIGRYGVTCNAYAPRAATGRSGPVEVARFKRAYEAGLASKRMYESILNLAGPEAMAPIVVYLATEEAGNINGQVFGIMGTEVCLFTEPVEKETIIRKEGVWTLDELVEMVPKVLLKGYVNPAPPQP